jgi:hypothetical protein
MKKPIVVGGKYNKLTVLGRSATKAEGVVLWDCKCECGKVVPVASAKLNFGRKKTCGCARGKAITAEGEWIPSTHHWFTKASRIMSNAKRCGVPFGFESTVEFVLYLDSIAPKKCPVFGKPLIAGEQKHHNFSPSVDRVIPEKGYVRGNIQVISYLANRMKNNATPKQLKQFAHWALHGGVK